MKTPIPGMSLTDTPKNRPYERPPKYSNPEDALQFHITNLSKEGPVQGIVQAVEMGMPIKDIAEGILRVGVAKGLHTVDVSLVLAPFIHEIVKGTAEAFDLEYEEGFENKQQKQEFKKMLAQRLTREAIQEPEVPDEEPEIPVEEPEPRKLGLGARRGM